jgi:hypothetical protein
MKLIESDIIDFYLIKDIDELKELDSFINSYKGYACIDTETYGNPNKPGKNKGLNPHNSLIALLQINIEENAIPWVIDIKSIGLSNSLFFIETLYNKHLQDITLIAHSASFEYKMLLSNFNIKFRNIKDSKTAMCSHAVSTGWKAARAKGFSLYTLAKDYFNNSRGYGLVLDKSLQTSNWEETNLTKEQLIYSAIDVGAPKGSWNPYKNKPLYSIVIEGYRLFEDLSIELNQHEVFLLDQKMVPILSLSEYNGCYMNTHILKGIVKECESSINKSILSLCKILKLPIQYSLNLIEDKLVRQIVIPNEISTVLNNSKKLVDLFNIQLKQTGLKLTNAQKNSIETLLKDLEQIEKSIDTEEEPSEIDIDLDNSNRYKELESKEELNKLIFLVKEYINYKNKEVLRREASKYLSAIDDNTEAVHYPINSVGASTGRMTSSQDEASNQDKTNLLAVSGRQSVIVNIPLELINKTR